MSLNLEGLICISMPRLAHLCSQIALILSSLIQSKSILCAKPKIRLIIFAPAKPIESV